MDDLKKKLQDTFIAPYEQLAQAKRVQVGFAQIGTLDIAAWRSRHLAYLSVEIDKLILLDLSRQATDDDRKRILALREEIAVTAGKAREFIRLRSLEKELDVIPPPRTSERLSRYDEYTKARLEVDRLKGEIAQAAEAMIASGKSKAVTPGPLPPSVGMVSQACLDSSRNKTDWFYGEGAVAPEFVIVLRRPLTGEALKTTSTPKFGDCI